MAEKERNKALKLMKRYADCKTVIDTGIDFSSVTDFHLLGEKLFLVLHDENQIGIFNVKDRKFSFFSSFGSQEGKLSGPHSIAYHNGLLYVADRLNRRIQIFTTSGEFKKVFCKLSGFPINIKIKDRYLFASIGERDEKIGEKIEIYNLSGELIKKVELYDKFVVDFFPLTFETFFVASPQRLYISTGKTIELKIPKPKSPKHPNLLDVFHFQDLQRMGFENPTWGVRYTKVDMDRSGKVYVINAWAERVEIFDREGKYLDFFQVSLPYPYSLHIYDEDIWVSSVRSGKINIYKILV